MRKGLWLFCDIKQVETFHESLWACHWTRQVGENIKVFGNPKTGTSHVEQKEDVTFFSWAWLPTKVQIREDRNFRCVRNRFANSCWKKNKPTGRQHAWEKFQTVRGPIVPASYPVLTKIFGYSKQRKFDIQEEQWQKQKLGRRTAETLAHAIRYRKNLNKVFLFEFRKTNVTAGSFRFYVLLLRETLLLFQTTIGSSRIFRFSIQIFVFFSVLVDWQSL